MTLYCFYIASSSSPNLFTTLQSYRLPRGWSLRFFNGLREAHPWVLGVCSHLAIILKKISGKQNHFNVNRWNFICVSHVDGVAIRWGIALQWWFPRHWLEQWVRSCKVLCAFNCHWLQWFLRDLMPWLPIIAFLEGRGKIITQSSSL